MAIPEVSLGLNRQSKHWVNEMIIQGVLTDAVIAPLTTVAGLRAVSSAALAEVNLRFYEMYQKAIDRAQAIGALTDALVAAANTTDGLLQIFVDNDPTLQLEESFSLVG